jgi:hypothetical protein
MPTSKKAMDLFLRDLEVAIETGLRDYRTGQGFHPDNVQSATGHLAGLERARDLAFEAIARTEIRVPADPMRFLALVDREATARALAKLKREEYVKRETRPDGERFVEPKRPDDHQLFEEMIAMFHECALTGSFPEPRLSAPE